MNELLNNKNNNNGDERYKITLKDEIIYINKETVLKLKNGIKIKKANIGKFTDYCGGKVTQKCIDKGKKSKNSKIRKRATFADNARKWKKEQGGILKYIFKW